MNIHSDGKQEKSSTASTQEPEGPRRSKRNWKNWFQPKTQTPQESPSTESIIPQEVTSSKEQTPKSQDQIVAEMEEEVKNIGRSRPSTNPFTRAFRSPSPESTQQKNSDSLAAVEEKEATQNEPDTSIEAPTSQKTSHSFWGNLGNLFKKNHSTQSGTPADTESKSKQTVESTGTDEIKGSSVQNKKKPFWGNLKSLFAKKQSKDTAQKADSSESIQAEKTNSADTIPTKNSEIKTAQSNQDKRPFWGNLKSLFSKKDTKTPQQENTGKQTNTDHSPSIESGVPDEANTAATPSDKKVSVETSQTRPSKQTFWGNFKNIFKKKSTAEPVQHEPTVSAQQHISSPTEEESQPLTSHDETTVSVNDTPSKLTNQQVDSTEAEASSEISTNSEEQAGEIITEPTTSKAQANEEITPPDQPQKNLEDKSSTSFKDKIKGLFTSKKGTTQNQQKTPSTEEPAPEDQSSLTEKSQHKADQKKFSWKAPFGSIRSPRWGLPSTNSSSGSSFFNPSKGQQIKELSPDHLGVVSQVKGSKEGPFRKPGNYQISEKSTGLLLPVGQGQLIQTKDHQIQMILKKPVLISMDQHTQFKIQKILDIHEVALEKGRLRIKLLKDAGLWTLRSRDMSLSLAPSSDVNVDMTGSMITRVTVIEGEAHCLPIHDQEPKRIIGGQTMTLGLTQNNIEEASDEKLTFLKKHLNISSVEDYQKKLSSAQAFETYSQEWPLNQKVFSGALCTQCGYGFDTREQPFSHCPSCHEPILSQEKTDPATIAPPKSSQIEKSSIDFILGALRPKLSLR